MIKSASNYRSKRNFFEMVRFDFVVDEDLNVYIMEVRQVQILLWCFCILFKSQDRLVICMITVHFYTLI
jgi:hypothetical protein